MESAHNETGKLLSASLHSFKLFEYAATNIVTTSILLITTLLMFTFYAALPKPIPGVPYTQKSRWSPFGDAVDFVNYTKQTGEGFRWFATKSRELQSPIFQVFLGPFRKPIVVVADIQELIDISSRRTKEFDRGGFLTEWVGILFPEGTISMPSHDKFKQQRNTWAVTMTSQFLNTVSARTIHQHTISLVRLWATKVALAKGRPFEVIWTAATGDDLGLITRRIEAAEKTPHIDDFGDKDEAAQLSSPNHLPSIVEVCHTLVEHLQNMRGSVWLTATKIWISFLPSWKKAWQIKESVMMQLIQTSRSRFASSSDVQHEATCAMDEIFKREARAEAKGQASTVREMIDETFAYIVGGHETTQDTTKWSMKYLTAYQEKQRQLREQLLEMFPGANANNLPSYQEIVSTENPFVEASIQELIRIALTAPSWTRRTTQQVMLLGHLIPPGIDVFGAPSVQSLEDMDDYDIEPQLRSASSKPRATSKWDRKTKGIYQPERWLDTQGNYDGYAGPMLPFGAGPRGCFGQRLARLELRMMIIMLVLSFEFKPIPEKYASFRAEEVINRGPAITYIRPVLRA
ncbi:hypothetical protein VN97_g8148 [Penicillium thymicola]|uniref:Cytochrome P450 n=1 Tax=Penicillium thymicola TaxID=293382 RepID=A0AAI9TDQ3_PENTH|nr:hypothetical protein VN97_g8148 [Penicillium thymicola]